MLYKSSYVLSIFLVLLGCAPKREASMVSSSSGGGRRIDHAYEDRKGFVRASKDYFDGNVAPIDRREMISRALVWDDSFRGGNSDFFDPRFPETLAAAPVFNENPQTPVPCKFLLPIKPGDAPGGLSPKLSCHFSTGLQGKTVKLKVKYVPEPNEERDFQFEPYAVTAASRMLRAFGFFANYRYVRQVKCEDCPIEGPWKVTLSLRSGLAKDPNFKLPYSPALSEQVLSPVVLEVPRPAVPIVEKPEGGVASQWCRITDSQGMSQCSGWSFDELFRYPYQNGNPKEEKRQATLREALVILMGIIQHTDNKTGNQQLECPYEEIRKLEGGKWECKNPALLVVDPGRVFGSGDFKVSGGKGIFSTADHSAWKGVRVWRSREACELNIGGSVTGGLFDTKVTADGLQKFFELFENANKNGRIEQAFRDAHFDQIGKKTREHLAKGGSIVTATNGSFDTQDHSIADWTNLFSSKVTELMQNFENCKAVSVVNERLTGPEGGKKRMPLGNWFYLWNVTAKFIGDELQLQQKLGQECINSGGTAECTDK